MPMDSFFKSANPNYPFSEMNTVQEPDIVYTEVINYLHINSSDRNVTSYPKVNSYKIHSPTVFKNIKSIELVAASIPNQNTPLGLPYLVLKIDGLNHIPFSNNKINTAFDILYLTYGVGLHLQPDIASNKKILMFKTPLASFENVNLQILRPDSTLFDFGESNGDVTTTYSNSFLLKIITLEKSRTDLRNRATF